MTSKQDPLGQVKIFRLRNARTGKMRGYLAYQFDYGKDEINFGYSLAHKDDAFNRELGQALALTRMTEEPLRLTKYSLFPSLTMGLYENNEGAQEEIDEHVLGSLNSVTGWNIPVFRDVTALGHMIDNMSIRSLHHSVVRRMAIDLICSLHGIEEELVY